MRSTPTFQIITLRLREAQLQPSRNWQGKWKGWPCRGKRVPEGRVRVPQAALPAGPAVGDGPRSLPPAHSPPRAGCPGAPPAPPLSPGARWGGRRGAGRSPEPPSLLSSWRRLHPRAAWPVASLLVSFPKARALSFSLPPAL